MIECIHNVSEVVEVFLLEQMGFSGKVVEPPELDLELQGLLTITQFHSKIYCLKSSNYM